MRGIRNLPGCGQRPQVALARPAGALAGICLLLAACGDPPQPPAHLRIVGGDAERGRLLMQRYECGSCHQIQGVRGAEGVVGPPLTNYAQRSLLAGIVPNAPRTLVPWLMNPAAIDPDTAMPNLGISEPEARDMATYLYTLGADKARIWPPEALPLQGRREEASRPPGADARMLQGPVPIERAMEIVAEKAGRNQADGAP